MYRQNVAFLILRLGLIFFFAYSVIAAFAYPIEWVSYLPSFIRGHLSTSTLSSLWTIVSIILISWILPGRRIFIPSLISAGLIVLILIINIKSVLIVLSMTPILAIALALSALYFPRHES